MKNDWSSSWKSSKQPRKQRKYVFNAPLHIRRKFMAAHLSKELQKKYNRRSFPIRKGDIVKIMRGQFKNKKGDLNNLKVYLEVASIVKRDGTKSFYPIFPSNLLITEFKLDDKMRKKALERTKNEKTS